MVRAYVAVARIILVVPLQRAVMLCDWELVVIALVTWHTHSEADLGMFSMFGRTGAPTKSSPHKKTGKFFQHSNMSEIIKIIIRKDFVCAVASLGGG